MRRDPQIRCYNHDESGQVRPLSKRVLEDAIGASPEPALDHDMNAVSEFVEDVQSGDFPLSEHAYEPVGE